jgi:hypothetical protein
MRKNHNSIHLILEAISLSVIALIISYFSTNINISITGEKAVLKYWNAFTDWTTSGRNKAPDEDVVFINVANDKLLVDVADEFGIPIGNAAITDRAKLNSLLSLIQTSADYQYVLLDVFFEEGYQTDADSALFPRIEDMDRIVIPKHKNGSIAVAAPVEKAAFADYNTSINENDFTKYQLFQKDGPSVPLRMYSDKTGRTVKRKGLWYADKSALSRKVVFPKMYVRVDSPYRFDGQKAYLNLGADILDYAEEQDWAAFFSGKIIVIGSFTGEDIHTTYAGDVPGCLINYNVFLSLMKGQHKIPFVLIIVYFLIFFGMAYILLRGESGTSQPWAWVWAKLFVLYSVILTIVCIFVFIIWGQAHDIFITSTFFSVVDLAIRRMKAKK